MSLKGRPELRDDDHCMYFCLQHDDLILLHFRRRYFVQHDDDQCMYCCTQSIITLMAPKEIELTALAPRSACTAGSGKSAIGLEVGVEVGVEAEVEIEVRLRLRWALRLR